MTLVTCVGVPRAKRSAEGRRVRHGGTIDVRAEHVGHDLENLPVDRRASRGVNRVDVDAHPARMKRHRHHLRFDHAADVPRGVIR